MKRTCNGCQAAYDDAVSATLCPHALLLAHDHDPLQIPPRGALATESEVHRDAFGWTVTIKLRSLNPGADERRAVVQAWWHLTHVARRHGLNPEKMLALLPEESA